MGQWHDDHGQFWSDIKATAYRNMDGIGAFRKQAREREVCIKVILEIRLVFPQF
jgi:hypothetical protein